VSECDTDERRLAGRMQVATPLKAGGLRQPAGDAEGIESIGPTISSWESAKPAV